MQTCWAGPRPPFAMRWHLRHLTHGLFPSLLANEGLRAPLDELVSGAEVPMSLEVRTDVHLGADIAMAAYATVAAALEQAARSPRATSGHVKAEHRDGVIVVAITARLRRATIWFRTTRRSMTESVRWAAWCAWTRPTGSAP